MKSLIPRQTLKWHFNVHKEHLHFRATFGKFLTKTEGANGRFCAAGEDNCFQTKVLTTIWEVLSKTMWLFRVTADGAAGFVGTHEVGTMLHYYSNAHRKNYAQRHLVSFYKLPFFLFVVTCFRKIWCWPFSWAACWTRWVAGLCQLWQ